MFLLQRVYNPSDPMQAHEPSQQRRQAVTVRHALVLSAVLVLAALVAPTALVAQPTPGPDLSGNWALTVDSTLPQGGEGAVPMCHFSGRATVDQQPDQTFTGDASLNLDSGAAGCPAMMAATLEGTVNGTEIEAGMMMGELGQASFSGAITARGAGGSSISGEFSVQQGPFTDSSGTFGAVPLQEAPAIPTLGIVGLALLAALLAAVAAVALARRRRAA
jgi:hypothetical protein